VSLLNGLIVTTGTGIAIPPAFVMPTSAIAAALDPRYSGSSLSAAVVILLTLMQAALLGTLIRRRVEWAFWVGGVLVLIDAVLAINVGAPLFLLGHAATMLYLYRGWRAAAQLREREGAAHFLREFGLVD